MRVTSPDAILVNKMNSLWLKPQVINVRGNQGLEGNRHLSDTFGDPNLRLPVVGFRFVSKKDLLRYRTAGTRVANTIERQDAIDLPKRDGRRLGELGDRGIPPIMLDDDFGHAFSVPRRLPDGPVYLKGGDRRLSGLF